MSTTATATAFGGSKKLKIQHRLLLLVSLSAIIPAMVVGVLGMFSAANSLSDIATATLQEEVDDKVEEFDDFLSGVSSDVRFLSKAPSIQGLIGTSVDSADDASSSWISQMQLLFTDMMQEKPYYTRIRYVDISGRELVGVDSDGEAIAVMTNSQLQNIAERGYFAETLQMEPGSVYVSPMELNRENGEVEEPYKPVIRYSTPVVDAGGQVRGILVANIFAEQLISEFAQIRETDDLHQSEDLMLANQDGYYLYHPDERKTWGFELGNEDETLINDFSADVADEILNDELGVVDIGSHLLSHHKFVPDPAHPSALIAIAEVPKGVVYASVNRFKLFSAIAILVSLGVVTPVAMGWGRQLVKMMEKLSTSISTSSQEMATTIAEQERVASQQASSVNETTTTMDELEASSRHASEQANAAVAAARNAYRASEEGSHAVGESLEGMFSLETKVDAISAQIVTLSDQASQIGSISQLVIDFANQTNMLALNSSVEAVRAGEHGKGFAVVANEIRKLADQSQQSADKINNLVSSIQKTVNATVMVTDEGSKTVKTNVQIAKRTDAAFEEVKEAVNQVVLNNQQVSLNLKQQVDAITQVVDAMDVINRGAKETASGLTQTRAGTDQLNDAAVDLQQMM